MHLVAVAEVKRLIDADLKCVVWSIKALGQIFTAFLEVGQALGQVLRRLRLGQLLGVGRGKHQLTAVLVRGQRARACHGEINRRRPLALRPLAVPGVGVAQH